VAKPRRPDIPPHGGDQSWAMQARRGPRRRPAKGGAKCFCPQIPVGKIPDQRRRPLFNNAGVQIGQPAASLSDRNGIATIRTEI